MACPGNGLVIGCDTVYNFAGIITLATTSLAVERQYDHGYNFAGNGKAVLLWLQLRWLWKGSIMSLATTSLAVERQYDSGYNFAGSGKAV